MSTSPHAAPADTVSQRSSTPHRPREVQQSGHPTATNPAECCARTELEEGETSADLLGLAVPCWNPSRTFSPTSPLSASHIAFAQGADYCYCIGSGRLPGPSQRIAVPAEAGGTGSMTWRRYPWLQNQEQLPVQRGVREKHPSQKEPEDLLIFGQEGV